MIIISESNRTSFPSSSLEKKIDVMTYVILFEKINFWQILNQRTTRSSPERREAKRHVLVSRRSSARQHLPKIISTFSSSPLVAFDRSPAFSSTVKICRDRRAFECLVSVTQLVCPNRDVKILFPSFVCMPILLLLRSIIICYSYLDIRLVQVFVTDYHENRKLSPFCLLQSLEKTTRRTKRTISLDPLVSRWSRTSRENFFSFLFIGFKQFTNVWSCLLIIGVMSDENRSCMTTRHFSRSFSPPVSVYANPARLELTRKEEQSNEREGEREKKEKKNTVEIRSLEVLF